MNNKKSTKKNDPDERVSLVARPTTINCCWIGGARYCQPLDATSEKKFRSLKTLGNLLVIGFSPSLWPKQFNEHARFYLLPQLPLAILRYLEVFTLAPIIALWLVLRHRVNILVAQSPYEGVAGAIVKVIAHWFGRKVVLVVESHGDFEESLFLQRRIIFPQLYRLLMNRTARFPLHQADLLRCVSSSTQEQLERWVPDKPIFKFTAWTDIEAFFRVAGQSNGLSSQKIIYTGVLIPRKGVHHLINAFIPIAGDFSQAQLIIVGREDNPAYAAQLKARVKELNLNRQIKFIKPMPQQQLAELMEQGCVFVLPSLSEALGRVVMEAMATGKPVIGSDVGGIPDLIEDSINGFLVPPENEEILEEKIRWVLEHPEDAKKMGLNGRTFAKNFFSTETFVQGYGDIFLSACDLLEKGANNLETSSI